MTKQFITQTAKDYDMSYEEVERIAKLSPDNFYEKLEAHISERSKFFNPPAKLKQALVIKSVCPVCDDKGYYFVNEWIGSLQGRKDCKCKGQTVL